MNQRRISERTDQIHRRFFKAVDDLIAMDKMPSFTSWCDGHGLHRPKYTTIRRFYKEGVVAEHMYKAIDLDALAYLSADFGVSADWLLSGAGNEFK